MNPQDFFARAWAGYASITPDADRVHRLLEARGERVINDHVAFRTFNLPGITRLELGALFEPWGYRRADETLEFPEKKLLASYWLPPTPDLPKVFVSELVLEAVPPALATWIRNLTERACERGLSLESLLTPAWEAPSYEDYARFYSESEYAAWTAAFGLRVNHFTVFVNALKSFDSLGALNAFLVAERFTLNSAGGVIKGTPAEKLEQSSTVARKIPWTFRDAKTVEVPSCYYEFARRHPMKPSGELFQGFIPKSADKIFESTRN